MPAPTKQLEAQVTVASVLKLVQAADDAEAKAVRYGKELVAAERRVREQAHKAKVARQTADEAVAQLKVG